MTKYQNWRYAEDLSIFDDFVRYKENLLYSIEGCNLADVRSNAGSSCGINGRKVVLDFL
jgi:hypothetical protein